MRVTFWGTRGSVPTPGPSTLRYGGNTSCVEMRTEAGTLLIFDSGTGIRELGLHLARQAEQVSAHLLLGHTHWDHISGFPFFAPAFVPGNRLAIYGARDPNRSLRDVLAGQMHPTYFPVPLGDLRADITFCELDEGTLHIDDAVVRTHLLNHTCVCMGYRVEADGFSVAYVTDHEPYGALDDGLRVSPVHDGDRGLVEFVRGVDLLIQDAQYTPPEYAERRGWGHGSTDYVIDVAVQAGARRVALFHHEPTHADADIDRMLEACRTRSREAGSTLEVVGAVEGEAITLARGIKKPG
ncbi:MAG: MBL fold metallo-hydrolase [Chloroflexi bacterium]|nr:MBL fold metallo-hydrolase [Chloroflexota bacterium]MBV9597067.1 MBL fold metallo-hydrolase [Chloroflexota bacterium]